MQESFDATTRVTMMLRRMGTRLSSMGGSDSLRSMASRAMSLCKQMAAPSEQMESLMVKPHAEVSKSEVQAVMKQVAPIYKLMIELRNEMIQLLKNQKSALQEAGITMHLKPLKM